MPDLQAQWRERNWVDVQRSLFVRGSNCVVPDKTMPLMEARRSTISYCHSVTISIKVSVFTTIMGTKWWSALCNWYGQTVTDQACLETLRKWCRTCWRCILPKAIQPKVNLFICPHEVLAIDFTVLEPASNGIQNVLL